MIVARSEETYYERERVAAENRRKQVINNKNNKKKSTRNKLKLFTSAIITLLLCMLVLFRYANITQNRLELSELKEKKIQLEKEKEDLNTELDRVKSSIKIEEDAKLKLGMDYPTEDQIVYVSVDDSIIEEDPKEESLMVKYFKNVANIVLKIF